MNITQQQAETIATGIIRKYMRPEISVKSITITGNVIKARLNGIDDKRAHKTAHVVIMDDGSVVLNYMTITMWSKQSDFIN